MFWRLILLPGKQLTSVVDQSFHLTMAALDISTVKNPDEIQAVYLEIDGNKTILCNLSKKQAMQVNLDLVFLEGTKMALSTSGSASVHLTGHIIIQDGEEQEYLNLEAKSSKSPKSAKSEGKSKSKLELPAKRKKGSIEKLKNQLSKKVRKSGPSSDDDEFGNSSGSDDDSIYSSLSDFENGDAELDSDDGNDMGITFTDEDDSDDEEDGVDSSDSEPEDISPDAKKKDKSKQKAKQGKGNQKVTPDKRQSLNKSGSTQDTNDKKAKQKTPQVESKRENNAQTPQNLQKKKIEGGVTVQELKSGTGPVAKAGKSVVVFYVGKIGNREFDKTMHAPGFKFRLGRGEVIKGWDVGLLGMKVGGKRRITVPPNMGYGQKGSPPTIPPNSTLVFDVELKSVS